MKTIPAVTLAVILVSIVSGCATLRVPPVLNAASIQPNVGCPLATRSTSAWAESVKEANRHVTASLGGKFHPRVRVLFPCGGWVEFRPSPQVIAVDALPPLVAIDFPL